MHRVRKLPRKRLSKLLKGNLIFFSFIGLVTVCTFLLIFLPGKIPTVGATCSKYFPGSSGGNNIGYFDCADRANGGDDVLDTSTGGWNPAPSDSNTYSTCTEPILNSLNSTICPKSNNGSFVADDTSFSEQIAADAMTFCNNYEGGTIGALTPTKIQNGVGAWFIITKMDQKDPPISNNYCQGDYTTEIQQWRNNIQSEFNGNATFDYNYCPNTTTNYKPGTDDYSVSSDGSNPTHNTHCEYSYTANTYSTIGSDSGINDIFEYGGPNTGSGTVPAIAIWYSGTPTSAQPDFIIKYVCGNPVGQLKSHIQHELDVDFECVDENVNAENYNGNYQGLIVTINNGIASKDKIYLGSNTSGPLLVNNNTNKVSVTDVINPPSSGNDYGDWSARNFTIVSDYSGPNANTIERTYARGPCAAISCGTTDFQGVVIANQSYPIWATADVKNASAGPPTSYPFNIRITSSTGIVTNYSNVSTGYTPGSLGTEKGTANGQFTTSPNASSYTITWEWNVPTPANSLSNSTTGYSCSRVATVVIPQFPYFDVYAGDIESGINYGSCSTSPAKIYGNNNNIGSPPDIGASGQLAAIAPDTIYQFYSDYYNNSSPSPGGSALTFSNDPLSALGGDYPECTTNYYTAATQIPTTGYKPFSISGSTLSSSIPAAPSSPTTYLANYNNTSTPLDISNVSIPLNENVIVVVKDSNVYIHGATPVSYPASYSSINSIPSLEVITEGGDILIDSSVTNLNGTYVAQENGSHDGGVVDTCTVSNPPAVLNYANYTVANISSCQDQLTVNGAISAASTVLGRTYGDINGKYGLKQPAEIFQYNPEVWLPYLFYNNGTVNPIQSLNKLPPTL